MLIEKIEKKLNNKKTRKKQNTMQIHSVLPL
jgi:hypothetical protein